LADGTAVALSSTLLMDASSRYFTVLCTAPVAYKGGCLFSLVEFMKPEGEDTKVVLGSLDGVQGVWENRNPLATGEYGVGFDRELDIVGGWYAKLINLQSYYANGLTVGDMAVLPVLTATVKTTDYNDSNRKVTTSEQIPVDAAWGNPGGLVLTVTPAQGLAAPKAQTPVKDPPITGEYNYSELTTNATGLTISFTRATGLFKGSFNVYYDYNSAVNNTTELPTVTQSHVVKKVAYQGVLTPERFNKADGIEGRGFFLWADKSSYENPSTGRPVPYTFNWSYDFVIQAGE